jgi:hypothetical protein
MPSLRIVGEKRRKILEWVSIINIAAHHDEAKKSRSEGTGAWLFEDKSFEDWVESESSSIMWLHGKGMISRSFKITTSLLRIF